MVVSKDGADNIDDLSRLFKRPSLTVKFSQDKKSNQIGKDIRRFKNKMQSYFVHKKLSSDAPVDPMEDEERELTLLQSKNGDHINPDIRNTGNSTMKNSVVAPSHQNNKQISKKRGPQSNTEKKYDWLVRNVKKKSLAKEEIQSSDKYLEAQNLFSFENNYLTYDK